jgi:cytochrome c oxidase subunit 4
MSDAHLHHSSPDHVPHVTPLATYLKTFGALMVLTVITVGASYVDLGTSVNLAIAILIATVKATVVAAFFMHLIHDSRYNALALISSVVFLLIFVGFTMLDTAARGTYDVGRRGRPAVVSDPFAVPTVAPKASAAPSAGAPATTAAPAASAAPSAAPSAEPAASVAPSADAAPSAAPSADPAASSAPSTASSAAASASSAPSAPTSGK